MGKLVALGLLTASCALAQAPIQVMTVNYNSQLLASLGAFLPEMSTVKPQIQFFINDPAQTAVAYQITATFADSAGIERHVSQVCAASLAVSGQAPEFNTLCRIFVDAMKGAQTSVSALYATTSPIPVYVAGQ